MPWTFKGNIMEKLKYTWDEMYEDTVKLCNSVRELGFKPDAVVGLARGGVVPATIASHFFDVPAVFINWSLRDGKAKDVKAMDKVAVEASAGKKFLLIDDIVDSGDTISTLKERMFDDKGNIVYAALWFNPAQSVATVNLHSRIVDRSLDKRWVVFPWEYERLPAESFRSANRANQN